MMSLVSHRYESPSSANERNNISNILEKRTSKFYLNNSQSQTIKELMTNPKKRENFFQIGSQFSALDELLIWRS